MPFEELKARQAVVWGSAPWERIARLGAPVHEHIVHRLDPEPGVRFLDLATGTGAVALLAARRGANVTGLDLAPALIETARRLAAEEGLEIQFDVGDAENLPYERASFDAVSSSMGVIFAPDHAAIARELARVCRPGGRIAVSAWRRGALFRPVTTKYDPPREPGQGDPDDWGREEYVERLLGGAFELEFEEGDSPLVAPSGADAWELCSTSAGPFRARILSLRPDQQEMLRAEFVEFVERHRDGEAVRVPGPYVLILGRRR